MKLGSIMCIVLAGSAVLLAGCESFETVNGRSPGGAYGQFDRPGLGSGHVRDGRSLTADAQAISRNECH